jgi:hypothetical protein
MDSLRAVLDLTIDSKLMPRDSTLSPLKPIRSKYLSKVRDGYNLMVGSKIIPAHDVIAHEQKNVEFGYEDCQLSAIRNYRKRWMMSDKFIANKNKYTEQLQNVPSEFL